MVMCDRALAHSFPFSPKPATKRSAGFLAFSGERFEHGLTCMSRPSLLLILLSSESADFGRSFVVLDVHRGTWCTLAAQHLSDFASCRRSSSTSWFSAVRSEITWTELCRPRSAFLSADPAHGEGMQAKRGDGCKRRWTSVFWPLGKYIVAPTCRLWLFDPWDSFAEAIRSASTV